MRKGTILVLLLSLAASAGAVVVTFDDLPQPGLPYYNAPIPYNYESFSWDNLYYHWSEMIPSDSGYKNGTVSEHYIAYNQNAAPATITSVDKFYFKGAYLTAAWKNGLNITVEGYADGALVDKQTVIVNPDSPTWFDFEYNNIDTLKFTSFGGTNSGLPGNGEQFVMDNFTLIVPEPMTVVLLSFGAVFFRRKK